MPAELVAGDSGSSIVVTVKKTDGSAFDLTGCTAVLIFNIDRGATLATTTVPMTVESPSTDGKLSYQFAPGDLPSQTNPVKFGELMGEVRITDSLTRELTSVGPQLYARVRNRFA